MTEELYVEKGTGLVRKVSQVKGTVLADEPYKPNGKCIFVNPKTSFLEETESVPFLHGRETKTNDFKSNGNRVMYHPELKEFAEITSTHGWWGYNKVRDLPITTI